MDQAQMIAKLAPAIGLRAYWNAETLADNNFTPPTVAARVLAPHERAYADADIILDYGRHTENDRYAEGLTCNSSRIVAIEWQTFHKDDIRLVLTYLTPHQERETTALVFVGSAASISQAIDTARKANAWRDDPLTSRVRPPNA